MPKPSLDFYLSDLHMYSSIYGGPLVLAVVQQLTICADVKAAPSQIRGVLTPRFTSPARWAFFYFALDCFIFNDFQPN